MERGKNLVRCVFPAPLLDPRRMGNHGFDVAPLVAAIPDDAHVVQARHAGDYFFDFVVFRQSNAAADLMVPLVVGLSGYVMTHEWTCLLDFWQVEALERGVGFPVESFQARLTRRDADLRHRDPEAV